MTCRVAANNSPVLPQQRRPTLPPDTKGGGCVVGTVKLLRVPDVRRLAYARLATVVGDFALPVVLVVLVHGRPIAVGFVLGAHVAGSLVVALVGARLARRLRPERVIVASNLGSAAVQGIVVGLFAVHALSVPVLVGLVFCRGFSSAFFNPAAQGLRPRILAPEQRKAGNALLGLALATGVVLGPLVGWGLVVSVGAVGALGVDGLALVFSAVAVAQIRVSGAGPVADRVGTAVILRAGWREVRTRRWLLCTVVMLAGVNLLAAGPLLTLAPVVAGGAASYAAMLSAIGFGAVGGGVLCAYPKDGMWLVPAAAGPLALELRGPPLPVDPALMAVG